MGQRLFLIDGTALAYRSFFAFQGTGRTPLSTSTGHPTAATYGFCTTLRALLEREKPDAIAISEIVGDTLIDRMQESEAQTAGSRADVAFVRSRVGEKDAEADLAYRRFEMAAVVEGFARRDKTLADEAGGLADQLRGQLGLRFRSTNELFQLAAKLLNKPPARLGPKI